MLNMINENSEIRFQVLLNDKMLTETFSTSMAEQYISMLPLNERMSAKIVPVTQDGRQVLLG